MRYNADDNVAWNDVTQAMAEQQIKAQMQSQMKPGEYGVAGLSGSIMMQTQSPTPKRPPELPVVVGALNSLAITLMNHLVDLEKRLEPITSKPPQGGTEKGMNPVCPGSRTQFGSLITQASDNIEAAINRVRDLLDRLEI